MTLRACLYEICLLYPLGVIFISYKIATCYNGVVMSPIFIKSMSSYLVYYEIDLLLDPLANRNSAMQYAPMICFVVDNLDLFHAGINSVILVQKMACRLFSAQPLPKPILINWQLGPKEQTAKKFESQYNNFHPIKCLWNVVGTIVTVFVQALLCWEITLRSSLTHPHPNPNPPPTTTLHPTRHRPHPHPPPPQTRWSTFRRRYF